MSSKDPNTWVLLTDSVPFFEWDVHNGKKTFERNKKEKREWGVIVSVNNWCVGACYGNSRLASFSCHISDCLDWLWFICMSIDRVSAHVCMWERRKREGRKGDEESVFQCFILSASLSLFVFCSPQRVILDSVHFRVCSRLQIVWLCECYYSVCACICASVCVCESVCECKNMVTVVCRTRCFNVSLQCWQERALVKCRCIE